MSYQKLLRQMIGVTLVMLLLVGCGAPVATPTPIVIVVTATPQPIPTDTATPRPTLAPTPTPTSEPTPTPVRGIVALVTMTDDTVFEVDHVETDESYWHTSGTYFILDDYTERHLPLVVGPVALEIPLDKVEQVMLKPEGVNVKLIDGQQLAGNLGEFYRGDFNEVLAVIGQATVAGYSAEYGSAIRDIDSIAFARDNTGEVSATVTSKDGTVTENISQLRFKFDGGNTLSGVTSNNYVPLQIGAMTLEVTLADIETIQIEEDHVLLLLKSGEKLEGSIPSEVSLVGRTTLFDVPAAFRSLFRDIQSIVFQ